MRPKKKKKKSEEKRQHTKTQGPVGRGPRGVGGAEGRRAGAPRGLWEGLWGSGVADSGSGPRARGEGSGIPRWLVGSGPEPR